MSALANIPAGWSASWPAGWYVVRTQSRCEERARNHLNNQGFNVYLPRYKKRRSHARRVETVLRPLFPGYLFVYLPEGGGGCRSINGTIGVHSLVSFGAMEPARLSDLVVDELQKREDDSGIVQLRKPALQKGDQVRLIDGAFEDSFGLVEDITDERRTILLLDLLGRKVRVHAPVEQLSKVR